MTLYGRVTIDRETGEVTYSDPIDVTDEEFVLLMQPAVEVLTKGGIGVGGC